MKEKTRSEEYHVQKGAAEEKLGEKARIILRTLPREPGGEPGASEMVRKYIASGAGPRAGQYLVLGAKARAALDGRPMADLDDVRTVAPSALRHRVVTNFSAEAAGRTSQDLVAELLEARRWNPA